VAGKTWSIVGFSIYGFCLVSLFLASTLHHGVQGSPRVNHALRLCDYYAIYLLIAGTITAPCLALLHDRPLGWTVLGVAWLVAAAGIALQSTLTKLPKGLTNTLYVAMGWLGVVLAVPILKMTAWPAIVLLAIGGVLYTAGAIIFGLERPNPLPGRFGFHEIWHLFVIAAAASHYVFMLVYVLPYPPCSATGS
jgi:hemolysin III